jgi:16S rRNA U1498 N3-methylase RsmE
MSDKHTFALFTNQKLPDPQATAPGAQLMLTDPEVWHQAANVLRLMPEEAITLFDGNNAATITIQTLKKGLIAGVVTAIEATRPLTPAVHLYQGLLKKESFEAVAYCAAQMGATTLTPIIGKKIHRMWYSPKDNERLTKIMVAACQQAKQFVLPLIQEPVTVEQLCGQLRTPFAPFDASTELSTGPFDWVARSTFSPEQSRRVRANRSDTHSKASITNNGTIPPVRGEPVEPYERIKALLFEPDGKALMQALTAINVNPATTVYGLILGPEGGFTDEERQQLEQAGADCYALTPTILRSIEAATVALGALRSVGR